MNEEEIQKILDELHQVNPEHLNSDAKRLFEAIMKIADERDMYEERIKKAINIIDIYGTYRYETSDLLYSVLRGDYNE